MVITPKTRKSHYWNEDRFIIGENYIIVIDGATPLLKQNDFNEACWMVNYIKKNINKYQGSVLEKLTALSKQGLIDLPSKLKDEEHLPSASLSFVEYDDEYFHAGVLGDCEVTFITNSNEIIRCFSSDLSKLDNISIKELISVAKEKNIHLTKARPFINDTLIKHRKLINKPNGYSAFTLMENPILNVTTFNIKKEDVKEFYVYSDGFSQSFESLKIYNSHAEMFSKSLNIEEEIKKIKEASFLDPYCDCHPRLKKIDDITIVKVKN